MSIALRNEPNDNKYYMNGEWLNVCSRDAFGFSAKNEKGEIVYIRYNDCDWFARMIKQNNEQIEVHRKNIETYEHNQELALIAERKNALAVGQMRREWGVTLADANEEQKEKYQTERNSYYTNSMEATKWSNKTVSTLGMIRDLQSQNSKMMT